MILYLVLRVYLILICVGLGRLQRAVIVVNIDSAHRGYMWAIECGPSNEDRYALGNRGEYGYGYLNDGL